MKKIGKKLTLILCFVIISSILVQCAPISQPDGEEGTQVVEKASVESIGICFTEGHIANRTQEAIEKRFQDYVNMGVKTLRIETEWVSLSKGHWTLSGEIQDTLNAAIDAGLRLKLISPTIMVPQSWVTSDADSTMVNYNGMKAVNTLSYWYDGLYDYTKDAINSQLAVYEELGILDSIDALVVDFGPAGEPLYPAAWTQTGDLENPDNASTSMWCYGDNAVADFREKMLEKYGGTEEINEAWGTDLTSMDDFQMPLPGTVKGTQWEDILTWYLESKRVFIEKQIQIFQEAVNEYTDGRIQLVLYMPGASFTQAEWDECIETGSATFAMLIGCENEFMVDMAAKYDCLLQFTGLPGIEPLKQVRQYMYENGYGDIPVYAENYADYASSCDPEALYQVIEDFNLAGIDYTFTSFLYKDDGVTPTDIFDQMADVLPKIEQFITDTDYGQTPYLLSTQEAKPEGDVLAMHAKLDSNSGDDHAYICYQIALLDYKIQEGDVLEYDVKISVPSNGFGFIDGMVEGAGQFQNMLYCVDQYGILAAATDSLAVLAGGQWMHRIVGIDIPYCSYNKAMNTVGKTLKNLSLLAQPRKLNGSFANDQITVWYDNIVISNDGEVKLVIFQSGEDLAEGSVLDYTNATVDVRVEPYKE